MTGESPLRERSEAELAVELANAIERVCTGYPRASVLLAIGLVLGAGASDGGRPDLPNLMRLVQKVAQQELDRRLARRGVHA